MKGTNPKKAFGDAKPGLGDVPTLPLYLLGEVMKGGAAKYGPYNWVKDPVSAATYVDAALRHLLAWRDGEDFDPESNLPHLAHVMANMAIMLDAQAGGTLVDDRRSPAKPIGEWLRGRGGTRSDAMSEREVWKALQECDPQWGGATEAPMQQTEPRPGEYRTYDPYRERPPTLWCRHKTKWT